MRWPGSAKTPRRSRRERQTLNMKRAPPRPGPQGAHSSCCVNGGGARCCASPGATSPGTRRRRRDVARPLRIWRMAASVPPQSAAQRHARGAVRRAADRRGGARVPSSCSAWASSAAWSSIFRRTSISCSCSPRPGETDGARVLENEEYFNRLGREIIRLLDARTEDGFVFRVDMRLRPFGDSGPLVVSLGGARGLPAAARPRLGAVRVGQGAGHRRSRGLRAGPSGIRASVRVSPLPRFRGVRVAARDEGHDRSRGGAARSRRTT